MEDKNTIESFLQVRLREAGKKIRVVSCRTLEGASTLEIIMTRVMVTQLKKGDMIVIARWGAVYEGIRKIELTSALEKHHVNPNWFTDHIWHCNHKVNAIYADAIYDALLPVLEETVDGQGKLVAQDGDYIKPLS